MSLLLTIIRYTVQKIGILTLIALTLLTTTMFSLAWGFSEAVKSLPMSVLLLPTLGGMVVGWLFGRGKRTGPWSALWITLTGAVILLVRAARVSQFVGTLLYQLGQFFTELARWSYYKDYPFPSLQPTGEAIDVILGTLGATLGRTWVWVQGMLARQPAFDPVVTTFLWGLLLWVLCAWAGWWVRRTGRVMVAITPGGALLAATLNYVRPSPSPLLLMLASILGLLALVNHTRREEWVKDRLDFPSEIRADLGLVAVPLAVGILAIAALMPSISISKMVEMAREWGAGPSDAVSQVGQGLGFKQMPETSDYYEPRSYGGLPRSHLIGSGPELSKLVVMTVQVLADSPITGTPYRTDEIPKQEEGTFPPPGQYYWRYLTYEQYNGAGWYIQSFDISKYKAQQPVVSTALPGYRLVKEKVTGFEDLGQSVFVTGQLVTVSEDYSAAWRKLPPEAANLASDMFGATTTANAYEVESLVPGFTEEQLRATGVSYPTWIRDRYLALPKSTPERVRTLALDLTARASTPYERALAIEAYLRQFPYTLDVPANPEMPDIADYFLFELKRGYCDYYATSMVVLARAAGLPARMVIGYATGTYDEANHQYVVTEADAHSWPEVYFPGAGWVEFEPTGGRPAIERLSDASRPDLPMDNGDLGGPRRLPRGLGNLPFIIGFTLVMLFVVGDTYIRYDAWKLRRLSPEQVAELLYGRLRKTGAKLAPEVKAGDTPIEFKERMEQLIQSKQGRKFFARRMKKMLDSVTPEVNGMVDLYNAAEYTPRPPSRLDQLWAISTWGRLRVKLWLAKRFLK